MNKQHFKIAVCVACMASLIGCAAPKDASHGDALTSDRIQQVITTMGPKFVDCGVAHCPTRTPKSIGGDAQAPDQAAVAELPAIADQKSAGAPSGQTEQEQLLKAVTVHFKWNSSELGPAERAKLSELAPILKDAKRVKVVGRTDGTGAAAVNDRLANKRAMSVMLYLRDVLNGTQDNKVELSSKGLCCYVADNESQSGRSMNRRAEVQVFGDVLTDGKREN